MGVEQSDGGVRRVAAFDFDGTLSRRDTLIPFLIALRGRRRFAGASMAAMSDLRGPGRDAAKSALLRRLVRGVPFEQYRASAEAYGRSLPRQLRADVVARLGAHKDRGHEVFIVSASLRDFLEPVAEHLGADGVIATSLEVDGDGRLTGALAGKNVRGAEKPRRLLQRLGEPPDELWAYGNSGGDRELLAMADHATWVRTGRRLPPLGR